MVRLEDNKFYTENKVIEVLPLPRKVYIPLSQHLGQPCKPIVAIGDILVLGQKIGSIDAHLYAAVHASIPGKVVSIEDYPHPILGKSKVIVIERDGSSVSIDFKIRPQDEVDKLTPQEVHPAA